ncbi:MAG: hypothetical protein EBU62_15935 [Proteobacteria bacterium]|nr:hypothetical protein [Pseudomonadota bacterium]
MNALSRDLLAIANHQIANLQIENLRIVNLRIVNLRIANRLEKEKNHGESENLAIQKSLRE